MRAMCHMTFFYVCAPQVRMLLARARAPAALPFLYMGGHCKAIASMQTAKDMEKWVYSP